ncbi:MAG: DMT family transporter [Succinatimonas sp.]|nr:DMT family transporter [Succinatimonas sp.]
MLKIFLLMHLSVFIAGFTGVFGRLIEIDSYSLVLWRMVIAFSTFAIFMYYCHLLQNQSNILKIKAMGIGALLMTHLVTFYLAIKLSNVSIGVTTLSTMGFFAAVCEPIIFRKKYSIVELLLSVISIVGILFIFGFDSRYRLGIAIGLISAFLATSFFICNKKISAQSKDYLTTLFWQLAGGLIFLVVLLPFYLFLYGTKDFIPSTLDWLYLLILGTICTSVMYLIQLYVVKRVSAFSMALTGNLEPIYSIVLAMIIFNENQELNFVFYVGILFIAVSVLLQTLRNYRYALKERI